MAALVAQKGLNPEAPEYFPQHTQSPTSLTFDHHNLPPPPPIFSFPNPPFYYLTPPHPYLQTYTSLSHPDHYLTDSYLPQILSIIPQQHDLLPAPATAPAVSETLSSLTVHEQTHVDVVHEPKVEQEAVAPEVKPRGVNWGYRNRCFGRRGGGRERLWGHESQGRRAWRAKYGNSENRCCRNIETSTKCFRNAKSWALPKLNHPVVPVHHDGQKTTVMIRNIPNRYTRKLLLEFLDNHCMMENEKLEVNNSEAAAEEHFVTAYDLLYLPIDFKTNVNKGYAFVNFTDPRAVWKFHLAFHNKKWDLFCSPKICQIACARLQGKEELVKHLKDMPMECESEEFLPICFSPPRDGSKNWVKQWTVGKRIDKLYLEAGDSNPATIRSNCVC